MSSDTATEPEKKRPKRSLPRRIMRGILFFTGGILTLVVLLVAGIVVFLSTDRGKELLRTEGLKLVNNTIPGRIELDALHIAWLNEIEARGFRILTPDGKPVIAADAAVLRYELLDLLKFKATVHLVQIDRPVITLAYDAFGRLNLDRALGPSEDKPSEPWDGTLPLAVSAPALRIVDGAFSLTDVREADPVRLKLDNLDLEASYHYTDVRHDLAVRPLTLQLGAPAVGQARLETQATYSVNKGDQQIELATLTITAPGLDVRGGGRVADFDHPHGKISIVAPPVTTEFLQIFSPDLPLEGQYALRIDAEGDRQRQLKVDTRLDLPKGFVTVQGGLDLSKLEQDATALGYDLAVQVRDVDLAPMLKQEVPPVSPINATAHVAGNGVQPEKMAAKLELKLDPLSYEQYRAQGGTVVARIENNVVTVEDSRIDSPYGRLFAEGTIDLKGPIHARARAEVDELANAGALVDQPLHGAATLIVNAKGDIEAPEIVFALKARDFVYGSRKSPTARVASIDATGDLRLPKNAKGEYDPMVKLSANGTKFGVSETYLQTFDVSASYGALKGDGRLTAADPQGRPVILAAEAQLEKDKIIHVRELEAPLGEVAWRLKEAFTVTVADKYIDVTPFVIAGADGELTGKGRYSSELQNNLELVAKGLNLKNFAPLMPESMAKLRGSVDLNADIKGPASAPELTGQVALAGVAAQSIPEISGLVRLTTVGAAGSRTALQTDLFLKDGGQITTRINIPMVLALNDATRLRGDQRLGGYIRVQDVNLGMIAAMQPDNESVRHLAGKLSAYLQLEGTRDNPSLSLDVVGREMQLRSPRPLDADLRLRFANERVNMTAVLNNPNDNDKAVLDAKLDFPVRITPDFSVQPILDQPVDGRIVIDAREARSLAPLIPELERTRGLLAMNFRVTGTAKDPTVQSEVRVRQLQLQAYPSADVDVELAYGRGEAAVLTRAKVADQPTAVIEARLRAPIDRMLEGGDLVLSDLKAAVDIPSFDLMVLPAVVRGPQLKKGVLTVKGTLESPGSKPVAHLYASLKDLSVGTAHDHDITVRGDYGGDQFKILARAVSGAAKQAEINGKIPLDLRLPLAGGATQVAFKPGMEMDVDVPGLDVSLANAFLPNRSTLAGVLRGEARLTGALDAPDIRGTMRLSRGQLFMPADGVFYDQIRLAVNFTSTEITLQEAVFRGGKGRLNLDGGLKLVNGSPGPLDITATFKDFVAMDGTRGRLNVNGALALRGTADRPQLIGDITIPNGVIKLPDLTSSVVKQVTGLERSKELAPEELPPNVYVLTPDGQLTWAEYLSGEKAKKSEPLKMDARVKIHIAKGTWVENEAQEVVVEVTGDVVFIMENGEPRMAGKIETVRGEIRLFAETLVIQQGTVTFTGGAIIDPRLDIVAKTKESPEYGIVTMRVTGLSSNPKISFESDRPQYDTADALAIVVVGKPLSEQAQSGGGGGGDEVTKRLQSLAAGALSGPARKAIGKISPVKFDLLQIEASSFTSGDLKVGKYVTPRLFLIYRTRFGESSEDENTVEAQAEYQLTRELYLKSFYGDKNIWGGELLWRHYY